MVKSHAAGWEPEKPTFAQLKEFITQVDEGRITKDRLQAFLNAKIYAPTYMQAEIALGLKNFFGPEQWRKFFGSRVDLREVPDIPWSFAILENPPIQKRHFLFLGLEKFEGEDLTLKKWNSVLSSFNIRNDNQSNLTCGFRWYMMSLGLITLGKTFDEQFSELPEAYEVPNITERVTANILYHLLNERFLDTGQAYVLTDTLGSRGLLSVGATNSDIYVSELHDGKSGFLRGLAASLKI